MIENYVTIVAGLGDYFREPLSENQLKMYSSQLMKQLTPEQLIEAIEIFCSDPANIFFPLPAKLISIIRPVETEKDVGQIVAARILTAVGKFGYTNPIGASEYIGDHGWRVVQLQGGWNSLCALSTDDLKAEQPRIRELAITIAKKSKNGTLDEAPSLNPGMRKVASIVGDTMKKLGGTSS